MYIHRIRTVDERTALWNYSVKPSLKLGKTHRLSKQHKLWAVQKVLLTSATDQKPSLMRLSSANGVYRAFFGVVGKFFSQSLFSGTQNLKLKGLFVKQKC